ncbi:helix-turn-helix transcriptional regulator [uncultured Roseovarius sp.]|uniref:helix-turn-helix domain-containing protein n=1 Tax=uncultured Roseovarius sp. TaxID=293344 RepID=UPI00260A7B14|nr:helix-turn-helix transcriptional regulator [uncultured Roseovarius sp.]
MAPVLQKNLRFLCAEKPSVAQVCRDIGINQQQFSKYLTGRAKPSAHNLRRIAQYFDVDENLMLSSKAQLVRAYRKNAATLAERRKDPLANSFPGDLTKLRPFLGAYQVFFHSPAAAGGVAVNAVFLDERNGIIYSRLIEVLSDVTLQSRRWTRCDGKVSYQGGRIFVVDNERRGENAFSMYILTPPHRQKKQYLFGTMCFLASLPRRTPYASKVAWKKFETYKSVRELFGTCGIHPIESLKIDPVIREFLSTGIED